MCPGLVIPAHAQEPADDAVPAAERLREAGDFKAAVTLLRAELAEQPDNGEAARLLAQTLYWLNEVGAADAVYETALARHPEDTTLRLQYARMLAETGRADRARALAVPLQDNPATSAEANTLVGTLAYWQGDFTTARRRFEAALRADPAQADARRQLEEILSATVPWIRVASDLQHDDQPLDRVSLGVDAGWFATPLTPIRVRAQPQRYRLEESMTRSLWNAEVSVTHFAAAARLDMEVAGGAIRWARGGHDLDWHGRAALGVRLPGHVTAGVRLERVPYLSTTASLDASLLVATGTGVLRWEHPQGWLGEAAYQHQRYPDGNVVGAVYGWQLVPLLNTAAGRVQAGYAISREHADETRFVLAMPVQPFPPGDPRFDGTGRYDPYYTPSRVITHSAIAAATWRPAPRLTVNLGGASALRATEESPTFVPSGGQVVLAMVPRTLSPWAARGSLDLRLDRRLTLTVRGEVRRTPFYRWSTAGVDMTYWFARNAGVPPSLP
jgi:uncharacterized protein (TIGR02996 family)